MKRSFFQAAVTSILLYGCTTWTLTKRLEKKLDGNYTRMLRAILNKSWQQHPTRHQLYGHLPPITKSIQVRRTRHAGHCWRSRDELIRDVLLWIPTHGRAKAGRPARTYIQQLCEDTGCCPEDLPRAMNDREEWRERVRDIRAASTIWWWWWWLYDIKYSYLILIIYTQLYGTQSVGAMVCWLLFLVNCMTTKMTIFMTLNELGLMVQQNYCLKNNISFTFKCIVNYSYLWVTLSVTIIVVGNGIRDPISNPGRRVSLHLNSIGKMINPSFLYSAMNK